jgi:PPE-repeat protein
MTSPNIRIDRLSLRVTGLDEDAARDLARLVAEGLAAGEFRTMSATGLDHLSVSVNTGSVNTGSVNTGSVNTGSVNTGSVNTGSVNTGSVNTGDAKPDALARHIVGEIYRAMEREVIP